MNFLIIGLGSMGKRRAKLALGLGCHKIFGVDSSPPRQKEAESLGITVFSSIEAALTNMHYHAAFVCTSPLSHAKITMQLLNAGLPIFSEINLVSDGYEEIIAIAKRKKIPLFLSSTMLYRAEIQYLNQQINQFAKPVNYIYHIGQYLPDWHPWENYKDFFVSHARTGGVREILGIELPWICNVFGNAKIANVQENSLSMLELSYPDSVFISLRHQNETIGFLAADVVAPKAVRNLEVFGEGLHLFWEGNPDGLYKYSLPSKTKEKITPYESFFTSPEYSDNIVEIAYLDEILNFIAVLEKKEAPRWSFEKDQEIIKLMDEIQYFSRAEST